MRPPRSHQVILHVWTGSSYWHACVGSTQHETKGHTETLGSHHIYRLRLRESFGWEKNYLAVVSPAEWRYDRVDTRDVEYKVRPLLPLILTIPKIPKPYSIDDIADSPGPFGKILTMAKEGPHIAGDATAFCQWYAQALHELNIYMWAQVSKDFKPRLDPEQSIPSTSVEIGGERIHLQPWKLGPDQLGADSSERSTARKTAAEEWTQFCNTRARFHPVFGRNIENRSQG